MGQASVRPSPYNVIYYQGWWEGEWGWGGELGGRGEGGKGAEVSLGGD